MAPEFFSAVGGASAVTTQPSTQDDRQTALKALLSCPTYSIHADDASSKEMIAARDSFPSPAFSESKNVFHLGFHDEKSFGAASYYIVRPDGNNIMFDVPRWNPSLASRIESMGGVKYIVLSHRDDVGAHEKYASRFGATRVIHSLETNSSQGTDKVEWKLEGEGPWRLGNDIEIIFTPGHTRGHIVMVFHPEKVLFTGDHLAYSARLQRLTTFPRYNWYSVEKQLQSVEKLIDVDFLSVLPGHGRPWKFRTQTEREQQLKDLLREETQKRAGQAL